MINKLRFLSVLFFFVSTMSSANVITFSGSVVESSVSALNTCLHYALHQGIEKTCRGESGTEIISTIKNTLVEYKGELAHARIVTVNYK